MWSPVGLWLRRSPAAVAFPALVVLVLATAWSRTGWQYEWDRAFAWAGSAAILLGPALAGLAAHDRARRQTPTLTLMERAGARGARAALTAPSAIFILGLGAWSVGALALMIWVAGHRPVGLPSFGVVMEVVPVLLAATFAGGAVGTWLPSRAAGPLAVIVVYGAYFLGPNLGLGGLMAAGGGVDSMVDMKVRPEWLTGMAAMHLGIALAGMLAIWAASSTNRVTTSVLLVVASVLVLAGAFGFRVGKTDDKYYVVPVEQMCLEEAPEICGPMKLEPMLRIAATGMSEAYRGLANSGLPLRERYTMSRGMVGKPFPAETGTLNLDSDAFEEGRLSRDDVLYSISTPTLCASYYDEEPPEDLMSAQSQVMEWVDQRLDRHVPPEAPREILDAYLLLRDCEPSAEPLG